MGWDVAVIALFSVAVYCWAQVVALPAREIERLLDEPDGARRHEDGAASH